MKSKFLIILFLILFVSNVRTETLGSDPLINSKHNLIVRPLLKKEVFHIHQADSLEEKAVLETSLKNLECSQNNGLDFFDCKNADKLKWPKLSHKNLHLIVRDKATRSQFYNRSIEFRNPQDLIVHSCDSLLNNKVNEADFQKIIDNTPDKNGDGVKALCLGDLFEVTLVNAPIYIKKDTLIIGTQFDNPLIKKSGSFSFFKAADQVSLFLYNLSFKDEKVTSTDSSSFSLGSKSYLDFQNVSMIASSSIKSQLINHCFECSVDSHKLNFLSSGVKLAAVKHKKTKSKNLLKRLSKFLNLSL